MNSQNSDFNATKDIHLCEPSSQTEDIARE